MEHLEELLADKIRKYKWLYDPFNDNTKTIK